MMMDALDKVWADPMWREVFRLAQGIVPRPVVGSSGMSKPFDPFDIEYAVEPLADGSSFGAPYIGVFTIGSARLFISAQCDTTIGNGNDRWDDDSKIDIQVATTLADLVRLAMSTEDRARLGYHEPPAAT